MRTKQAIKHFGSQTRVADILGINRSAVNRWGEVVPIKRAWELERLSKYKLSMRIGDYR